MPPRGLATNYNSRRGNRFLAWRETCEREKERGVRKSQIIPHPFCARSFSTVTSDSQCSLSGMRGKKRARSPHLMESQVRTVIQGTSFWISLGLHPLPCSTGGSTVMGLLLTTWSRLLATVTAPLLRKPFLEAWSASLRRGPNLQHYSITDFSVYYLESLTDWSSNAFIFNLPLLISKMCKRIYRKL